MAINPWSIQWYVKNRLYMLDKVQKVRIQLLAKDCRA